MYGYGSSDCRFLGSSEIGYSLRVQGAGHRIALRFAAAVLVIFEYGGLIP